VDAASVTSLVIDPTNSNRFYAPTFNGVLKSTDRGTTWELKNRGISTANLRGDVLTVHPTEPNTLFLGIGEALVVSLDGGESWGSSGWGANLRLSRLYSIVVDPFDENVVYVGGDGSFIFRSVDRGRTFKILEYTVDEGLFSLAAHPTQRNTYLAGILSPKAGIIKSENGVDFHPSSNGLPFGGLTESYSAITYAPSNPDIVYAGTGFQDDSLAIGIFKSTDGGESWQRIVTGLRRNATTGRPHYVKAITVDPNNPNIVFAATGGGLFKSTDGGATWRSRVDVPLAEQDWTKVADSASDFRAPPQEYGEWEYFWALEQNPFRWEDTVDDKSGCEESPDVNTDIHICQNRIRNLTSGRAQAGIRWRPHDGGTYRFEWDSETLQFYQDETKIASEGPGEELPFSKIMREIDAWAQFYWVAGTSTEYNIHIYKLFTFR
jgi:hypothetical protein